MQPYSPHWADQAATRVVAQRGDKDRYVVASGITPSGVVHIGNFREEITVDFVARALRAIGKTVRAIHSWDDFDTFRKVPANAPEQERLKGELRRPISRVFDPWGAAQSYADANIKRFEKNLPAVGIAPEFLYQHERYAAGRYAEKIRHALERNADIVAILNRFRTEPLPADWLPTSIYCEACDRDEMVYERYAGGWDYAYKCARCGHEAKTDIRTTKNLKLLWRVDWPMRWSYEQVDFEPGGKDHSSDGGSHDTAKIIAKDVFGHEPPVYLQYDFVSIKGGPGKMSSSSGNVIDLAQVLEVYAPEMVRWIFARQKPNTDFALAFDEDVIKMYEEFDRCEADAFKPGERTDAKWWLNRRVYELSMPGAVPEAKPFRPAFRLLTSRLQICGKDPERTLERYYQNEAKKPPDREAFLERARRAVYWLEHYAPEEFRYGLHARKVAVPMDSELAKAVALLRGLVDETDLERIEPKDLNQAIYDRVITVSGVEGKTFFNVVYQLLIGRDQGPRLPGFLKEIGKEKVLELL